MPIPFCYCQSCGSEASANPSDYNFWPGMVQGKVLKCCGEEMVIAYREPAPIVILGPATLAEMERAPQLITQLA